VEVSQKEFVSNAKSDIATRDQLASHFGCRSTGPVIGSKRLLRVEFFLEAVRTPWEDTIDRVRSVSWKRPAPCTRPKASRARWQAPGNSR
jgi:hypothetical protein